MAVYYFDSSALVKRFAREQGTLFILNLLRPSANNRLYASQITEVEVYAALARRRKGGTLTPFQVSKAQRRFTRDFSDRFNRISVTDAVIQDAVQLANIYELRGYDAVQLSCALFANRQRLIIGLSAITLISADSELNNAAQLEGLTCDNPNNHP